MSVGDRVIDTWYEHAMSELDLDPFFEQLKESKMKVASTPLVVRQQISYATTNGYYWIGLICQKCDCTFDWHQRGPTSQSSTTPSLCGGSYCHRKDPAAKDLSEFDALMSGQLSAEEYEILRKIGRQQPSLALGDGIDQSTEWGKAIVRVLSRCTSAEVADWWWRKLTTDREMNPPAYWTPRLKAMWRGMGMAFNVAFIVYMLCTFLKSFL